MLEPESTPVGAVVLVHGLTDSPYSLRHIARRYRAHGYVSVAIRLPGHGTVPSGLAEVEWEDWLAATRLAVREARRRIGPTRRLHLVGFSNGGALAMKYALDALEDPQLTRPEQITDGVHGPIVQWLDPLARLPAAKVDSDAHVASSAGVKRSEKFPVSVGMMTARAPGSSRRPKAHRCPLM